MSRKLLSHVSLSSLPRRLKSPREEVNSKSSSGPSTGDTGGWSKSSNPLEKLMQQAVEPTAEAESNKGEGVVEGALEPRSAGADLQRSNSGDSLECLPGQSTSTEAPKRGGSRTGKGKEAHDLEPLAIPSVSDGKKEGGSNEEKASKVKKSSSKRRKKSSTSNDMVLSGGGTDVKSKRTRKTRRNVNSSAKEERKRPSTSRKSSSRRSERERESAFMPEISPAPSPLASPISSPLSSPHRVRREGSAPSTRSSDTSEADEVLERTLRLVRSLSSYKFKRGASMDDILLDISSDGENSLSRSRREESTISPIRSSSGARVTKNMTTLANQVTLGNEESSQESQKRERASKKEKARREKEEKSRRPSLSISSLDLDDEEEEDERPNKGRKRKARSTKSPLSSPRRAALANLSPPSLKETEESKRRSGGRDKGADSPLLKRLSSAFMRATKKTSDLSEDPEEMEKFYQQKLKATVEVLESVHAAEMMAKRRYRQLQREERELLKKCEQLSHNGVGRSRGNSACETPVGVRFDIHTSDIGLCEQIGSGASGTIVYRCLVDGWACAVKELTAGPGKFYCDEERDAFEKEMAFLCQLPQHPNIVQYLFHSKMNQQYCLFMALYDGTLRHDINDCVAKSKIIDVITCTRIALEVAKGLAFLHAEQLLHRDIKADNVFIGYGESGEITRVAIGDFDSATRIGYSFSPDSCVGTPGFMAPEVMKCHETASTYSFEADVFSFGMLIYEMITLKYPYHECPSPIMVTKKILTGEPPLMPGHAESLYPSLVALHRRCIAVQPRDRPTMAEVRTSLQYEYNSLLALSDEEGQDERLFRSATIASASTC